MLNIPILVVDNLLINLILILHLMIVLTQLASVQQRIPRDMTNMTVKPNVDQHLSWKKLNIITVNRK